MPNKSAGLGIFPIFCIMMLGVGLMNHVMVLPPLLQEAKRDAWISVLAALLPYLAWIAALRFIMKRTRQQSLLPWVKERFGRVASAPLRLLFLLYLFCISALTLKETISWSHGTYLPRTPELVLSLSLMTLCFFAARFGIRSIAIVSGILLPFVIAFGDFVMSANLPRKEYIFLTPILEHGWIPVLDGSVYVGGGLAELVVLLLLQHQAKAQIKFWKIALLGVFLVGLILGPATGAIAEFGPFEAANMRYPAFEEWRLVTLGRYIQHVDFLSIYQWLSGAFVRISVSVYLMVELITDGKPHAKRSLVWLSGICVALVVLAELPFSDTQYLDFMKIVYLPSSLAFGAVVAGVLFILVLIPKRTKVRMNG
ncbi:spore gernimation protein [Paenibacillus antri]|uniref:Spore gernimation protein n=1 Tax=Paenibacillus antri TaxID=2582848 RepID=A0A5R9G1T1_9BACL|nr:endospore germination permease [Paenibacillus antri]TLS48969.1 spore gernimation protein [Paenibacillus antri]